jgi:virulence protein VirJ
MARVGAALWLAASFALLGGCAARSAHAAVTPHVADRPIVLNNHPLRLHFANAGASGALPLLVYATGDGGWHRKDLAAYRHLVSFGNPIVGFDARDYVTHLGAAPDATTTPARLAADYGRIIEAAKTALHLPFDYPVVLVGISRGAGLSVVAAGQRALRPSVAGVLAVALTREEEYVKWFRRLRRGARQRNRVMVQVYDYLPRLADMPLAVVQSTNDHYLPAASARPLFGPDTPYRWFQPIQARNHSFGGARTEMYQSMQRSLEWIEGLVHRRT